MAMLSSRGRLPGASAISSAHGAVGEAEPGDAADAGRGRRSRASSSHAIRPRLAPSAARIASSCCRPSARTSSRLATFAHAISSTMPIVAHQHPQRRPTSPIDVVLQQPHVRLRAAPPRTSCALTPGNGGNRRERDRESCAVDVGVRLGDGGARLQPRHAAVAELAEMHLRAIETAAAGAATASDRGTGTSRAARR